MERTGGQEPTATVDVVASLQRDLDAIEVRRAATAADIADAERDRQAASAALADDADADADARFSEAVQRHTLLIARLQAIDELLPQAQARLADAVAQQQENERLGRYLRAQEIGKQASRRFERGYSALMQQFAELLKDMTQARVAIQAANRDRPHGAPPIEDPENIRDQKFSGERVISEVGEKCWTYEGTGTRLTEELIRQVHVTAADKGILPSAAGVTAPARKVERRCFRRLEVQPATPPGTGPRIVDMIVPGLKFGQPHFWRGDRFIGPEATLQQFDTGAAAVPQSVMPALEVKYILWDDPAAAPAKPREAVG